MEIWAAYRDLIHLYSSIVLYRDLVPKGFYFERDKSDLDGMT
jgi:hypothetical protein